LKGYEMIPNTCGTCRFSQEISEQNIICRFNPPTPYPVPVQGSRLVGGSQPQMGQVAIFPILGKDNWCGQWAESEGE
jgi:hypothetical protein